VVVVEREIKVTNVSLGCQIHFVMDVPSVLAVTLPCWLLILSPTEKSAQTVILTAKVCATRAQKTSENPQTEIAKKILMPVTIL